MNGRREKSADDLVSQAFEALSDSPIPRGPSPDLVASTVEALLASQDAPGTIRQLKRRKLMFRIARYSGFAAAASILVVLGVWFLAVNGGAGVAFADVVQNVKEAKSVTLTCRQKLGRQPELEFKWSLQGNAIRMEIPGQMTMIGDIQQKKGLQLDHLRKIAYQVPAHNDLAASFANPIEQFRKIRPEDARRLGEEQVGEQKAIVYQLEKFEFMGIKAEGEMKIWVDPGTELPVKIQIGLNSRRGSKAEDRPFDTVMTFERFTWNKRLDPKLFSLEIPEGYEAKEGQPGPTG
ncbi:MAG: hypothetical protein H8E44_06790 [Planctomycetes bacterium]|nr:hypothetical protein [Planctomycetota bacterium]MBL7043015.1 hypothetical protein [Pirellulaceae bacterium]